MYSKLIENFSDRIDIDKLYVTFSFEFAKKELISNRSNLSFLLGEPGTGKTFILNYLTTELEDFIFLPSGVEGREELDNLVKENKLIIIDEAQLLSLDLIEYIRVLSDNGARFILAMHLKDGEKILKEQHFKSREIKVVKLDKINKNEIENYIRKNLFEFENLIDPKSFRLIYKFSKGNFRYVKRLVKVSFEILQFAFENRLKYSKIDKKVVTMSALDLGLLNE